jgi:hypothetical protein
VFDYTRTGHQAVRFDTNPVTHKSEVTPGYVYLIRDPIGVTLVVTDANGHTDKLSRVIKFGNFVTRIYDDDGAVEPAHPQCHGPALRGHFTVVSRATFRPTSRRMSVPITCGKGPTSCTGSIAISLPGAASRTAVVAARSRRLALTGFLVAPGKTAQIGTKLNASATKLLRKRHPRSLVVSVKTYGSNGKLVKAARQRVRLVTKR